MTTTTHPAHGPVSLDRLHQISEILSKASAQSDGGNLGYAMADAVKVINGAIASFGSGPVLYAAEETLAYAKMGELHLKCLSQPMGDAVIPLYRNAQSAPVVPDDLLSMAASAIEDLLEHTDPGTSYYSGVWADVPGKLRAAMLQAGNSPVTPDGYVLVPKEPTEAMMLHKSGCNDHPWDDPECVMRQTRRLVWAHMLEAAAQQEVKSSLEHGMQRYAGAMQKLADAGD